MAREILLIGECPPPDEFRRSDDPWDCESGDRIAQGFRFENYAALNKANFARCDDTFREYYRKKDRSAGLERAARQRLWRLKYPRITVVMGGTACALFQTTFKVELQRLAAMPHKDGSVFLAPHPSPRNESRWDKDEMRVFFSSLLCLK